MDHPFSFSGGNESTTYFISANFLDQDGLMKLSYYTYQRYKSPKRLHGK